MFDIDSVDRKIEMFIFDIYTILDFIVEKLKELLFIKG